MNKKNANRYQSIYLEIGLIAIVVLSLLGYEYYSSNRATHAYPPLIDATKEIRLEITTAHLWFEEILSGDRHEGMDKVWLHLEQAGWYAEAILQGGETIEGTIIPIKDAHLRQHIQAFQDKLFTLRKLTEERFESHMTAAAGTEIDQRYDALFSESLGQMEEVEGHLRKFIAGKAKAHRIIEGTLAFIILYLFVLAWLFFHRHERRQAEHARLLEEEINERIEAEKKLKASQRMLETLFDNAPIMIWGTDKKGILHYFNKKAVEIMGYNYEEAIGMFNMELHPPDERDDVYRKFKKHVEGNTEDNLELPLYTKSRERLIGNMTQAIYKDEFNKQWYFGFVEDVTVRKRAEEELKKLSVAIQQSPVSVVITDLEANIEYVNSKFYELTGYSAEEVLGKNPRILQSGKTPEEIYKQLWESILAGKEWRGEFINKKKNGDLYWEDAVVSPILDENGDITRFLAVKEDITERKQAEASIAEWKNRYEAAVQASGHILYDWNSATNEVTYGGDVEKILGYTMEEMEGELKRWVELIHPDDVNGFNKAIENLIATKELAHLEYRVRKKNGEYIHIEDAGRFITDAQGNLVRMIGFVKDITEHKQAEESLRLTQFALDHAPDAVYWMEPDGRFLYVNETACRTLGYSREELLSIGVADIDPNLPDGVPPELSHETKKAGFQWLETEHRTKDGRVIPVEVMVAYIEYKGKEYHCSFVRDITERKQAAQALHATEEKFSKAFHACPFPISISTMSDGIFIDVNESFEQLSGYRREEVIGRSVFELGFWLDTEARARMIDRVKEKGWVRELGVDYRTRSGEIHKCLISVVTVEIGGKQCLLVVTRDVTKEREIEEALRESEERFRGAFETAGHGMTLIKPDGGYLAVNPAFCEITGYSKAELLATDFQSITHPDDLDANLNLLQRLLAGEIFSYQFEKRYLHKQGHVVWVQLNVSHVRDKEGNPLYLVNQIQDISERKRVDNLIFQSRERLRNLATRLQAIREEERTMIAREIHDNLSQTLAGLKMDMFWLVDRLPRHWKKIPQRTHTMISLLDSTIDFVRKFSMELRPSILDDLGLAAAIEWQVNEFASRTDCKYTLDIGIGDLCPDHDRDTAIFRILQEALTNVAQHANADQVKVLLVRSDSQLVLTVKDNGTGMDEEKIISSSSLGLIGMRERAGALGGKIMIEKAEEGGTRVTLTVPYGGGVT